MLRITLRMVRSRDRRAMGASARCWGVDSHSRVIVGETMKSRAGRCVARWRRARASLRARARARACVVILLARCASVGGTRCRSERVGRG